MDSPPFGSRARAARQEERYSRCGNRLVLRAKRGTRLDVLSWLGAPLRLSVILVRFIASNALALPTERNQPGSALDPLTQPMQQVNIVNPNAYTTYRLTFTHVKNASGANSCQIGEVEFLGVNVALTIDVAPTFLNVYPGPGSTADRLRL